MNDRVPDARVTLPAVQAMKRDGRKIVGVVVWDYQMARIVDRAGVEIVSVGDSVGVNLWGQPNPFEVTMDQMVVVCQAVRRGVQRALLSCDLPYGPVQEGVKSAVRAAIRLVKEAGVDLVKLDAAADHLDAVSAVSRAGVPVFAQFGITPQTTLSYRPTASARDAAPAELTAEFLAQARRLEEAGAALLNFTNSGPVVGPEVARAVSVPVLGGFGGGPWLDGRMRMAHAAIGYRASALDGTPADAYANVARISYEAISAYADDVRAGRQIQGGIVAGPSDHGTSTEGG